MLPVLQWNINRREQHLDLCECERMCYTFTEAK